MRTPSSKGGSCPSLWFRISLLRERSGVTVTLGLGPDDRNFWSQERIR